MTSIVTLQLNIYKAIFKNPNRALDYYYVQNYNYSTLRYVCWLMVCINTLQHNSGLMHFEGVALPLVTKRFSLKRPTIAGLMWNM